MKKYFLKFSYKTHDGELVVASTFLTTWDGVDIEERWGIFKRLDIPYSDKEWQIYTLLDIVPC